MNIQKILAMCAEQDVQLNVENGELEVLFDDYPTDELISILREHKPQIIEFISTHNPTALASQLINNVSRDGKLRLSYSQQRLWLVDKMGGNAVQNNMSAAFHVNGKLNLSALQVSLDTLVKRHEILRTNYVESQGGTFQEVSTAEPVNVALVDLSDLEQSEKNRQVDAHIVAESQLAFNLRQSQKLRVVVMKLADDHHVIIFTSHFIAVDTWSMNILVGEFAHYYHQCIATSTVQFEDLPIQFVDFASWERDYFESNAFTQQIDYWRETLNGIPLVHSILDKPRPPVADITGAKLVRSMEKEFLDKLNKLARQHNVTLFILLQSAFALLIGRWSNESDVVIGTPVAGRIRPELEPLIGCFTHNLVLRTKLPSEASFSSYLAECKNNTLTAFSNQDIPFELMVDVVQPERSLSHTPLFQIMFGLQNSEKCSLQLEDAEVTPIVRKEKSVKFELDLSVSEEENGLELVWSYATSMFAADTIQRMSESFGLLLRNIVRNCDQDIHQLEMLDDSQKQTINSWNKTAVEFETGIGMHELFLRQALQQPNAVAVRDSEGSVTYEQLLRLSVSLAKQLKEHAVKKEELVGIRLPKGRLQIVATLGIIMSGGAYLPMETGWPSSRCKDILMQAGTCIIIVDEEHHNDNFDDIHCLNINKVKAAEGSVEELVNAVEVKGCEEDLAYVIFTSGSTGKPKGVAIKHGAVVNTLLDINQRYEVTNADKVLAVSALSFDLSVYDIFGTLSAGGEIVYPDDDKAVDPDHWAELIEAHNITLFNAVPASADLLTLAFERKGKYSQQSMRNILMSGDWISPTLPKRLWKVFSNAKTYSLGGATEASIWSISYPIKEDTSHLKSVPYGKPLANQRFYILNQKQQQVPIGVPGELYIGGKGVARCYFGDEERTKKSFIYHKQLNEYLYRTGDLGRYLPDGNIEFIGRVDHQVKILGFRVELGEIEASLKSSPSVKEAIVLALGNAYRKRLVAYVIPANIPEVAETKEFISKLKWKISSELPSYMVPSSFVLLDAFPLTANGKVNKDAFPAPHESSENDQVGPETETEVAMMGIWKNLLSIEKLSAESNFFDLGGNSLQLSMLVYEINDSFGIQVEIKDMFEFATLRSIAKHIDEKVQNKLASERLQATQLEKREDKVEVVI